VADNLFRTSDTALASYLITEGFFLHSIDYSSPRYQYLFPRAKQIENYADRYIVGQALTDPSSFVRVNKKLLRIISRHIQWKDD